MKRAAACSLMGLCMIVIAGGSGCSMNEKLSAEEKAAAYMEEKYGEEFRFAGWQTAPFGSGSKSAAVECDSLPDRMIRVDIRKNQEGAVVYSDNYTAYRMEEELFREAEKVTETVYPRHKMVLRIAASDFPSGMGPGMEAKEIAGDKDTLLSVLIFAEEGERDRRECLEVWRQAAEDAGLRMRGVLYIVDDVEKYKDISVENYQSRTVGENWYEASCYFAMDKAYEFYYANWR